MSEEAPYTEHLKLDLETLRRVAASVSILAEEMDRVVKLIETHLKEHA